MCLVAQLCPTLSDPLTVARQASLSMGFFRQEYWSGCVSEDLAHSQYCVQESFLPNLIVYFGFIYHSAYN